MPHIQLLADGKKKTRELGRKALAAEFELHHRDLRPLFSVRQVATIFSRGEAIIANLGFIKILISKDQALIFNLENSVVPDAFVPALQAKIKAREKHHFFELLVLDFALNYKVQDIKTQSEDLQKGVSKILRLIEQDYSQINLEKLLKLKKKVSKFEIVVRENQEAGEEILADDEELMDLCLSQKKKKVIDFDEAESILDSYTEQIEDVAHLVDELKENIDDTQEILSLKIDSLRNAIIRFELVATLVTALFALMAVVTGLYGMNIRNNLEQNHEAFWFIILVFGITAALFGLFTWRYLKAKKIV